ETRPSQFVCDRLAIQLLQEPESLLGERQRCVVNGPDRNEWRDYGSRIAVAAYPFRTLLDGRMIEEVSKRDLHSQYVSHSGQDFGRDQRMTAELEEGVGYAYAINSQNFLLDPKR